MAEETVDKAVQLCGLQPTSGCQTQGAPGEEAGSVGTRGAIQHKEGVAERFSFRLSARWSPVTPQKATFSCHGTSPRATGVKVRSGFCSLVEVTDSYQSLTLCSQGCCWTERTAGRPLSLFASSKTLGWTARCVFTCVQFLY